MGKSKNDISEKIKIRCNICNAKKMNEKILMQCPECDSDQINELGLCDNCDSQMSEIALLNCKKCGNLIDRESLLKELKIRREFKKLL